MCPHAAQCCRVTHLLILILIKWSPQQTDAQTHPPCHPYLPTLPSDSRDSRTSFPPTVGKQPATSSHQSRTYYPPGPLIPALNPRRSRKVGCPHAADGQEAHDDTVNASLTTSHTQTHPSHCPTLAPPPPPLCGLGGLMLLMVTKHSITHQAIL